MQSNGASGIFCNSWGIAKRRTGKQFVFFTLFAACLLFATTAAAAVVPTFSPAGNHYNDGTNDITVAGTNVTLTATTGTAPFRWEHGGTTIDGETGNVLFLEGVKVSEQGNYTAYDATGASQGTYNLQVYNQVNFAPPPQTTTTGEGQTVQLSATVDPNSGVRDHQYNFTWQYNDGASSTWNNITPGSGGYTVTNNATGTTTTLTFPATLDTAGYQYRVYAEDQDSRYNFFRGTSYSATTIVIGRPVINSITENVAITPGGSVTIATTFTPGTGRTANNYSFQWYNAAGQALTDGTNYSNSKSQNLTLKLPFDQSASEMYGNQYYLQITDKQNANLIASSDLSTVTVNIATRPSQGASVPSQVFTDQATTLNLQAFGGNTYPLNVVWQSSSSPNGPWTTYSGITGPDANGNYTTPAMTQGGDIYFRAVVSDTAGQSVNSGIYHVQVKDSLAISQMQIILPAGNKRIDILPAYRYVQNGTTLRFTATATAQSSPAPQYSWRLFRSRGSAGTPEDITAAATGISGTPTTSGSTTSTSYTFTYTPDDSSDYFYFIRVQNSASGAAPTADSARVEQRTAPAIGKPRVDAYPVPTVPDLSRIHMKTGDDLQLYAITSGGTGTEEIYWYDTLQNETLAGSPESYITVRGVTVADDGDSYYAVVMPVNDTFTSQRSDNTKPIYIDMTLTIDPTRDLVEIDSADLGLYTNAAFHVTTTAGRAPFNYQWRLAYGSQSENVQAMISPDMYLVRSQDFAFIANQIRDANGPIDVDVVCDVTDARGQTVSVSADLQLVWQPTLELTDYSTNDAAITLWVGQKASFLLKAAGGTGGFEDFAWQSDRWGNPVNIPIFGITYSLGMGSAYTTLNINTDRQNLAAAGITEFPAHFQLTAFGSDTKNVATNSVTINVTVNDPQNQLLQATVYPAEITRRPGEAMQFNAKVEGGMQNPQYWQYEWYVKNPGQAEWISTGVRSATYTIANPTLADDGKQYELRVVESVDGVFQNASTSNPGTLHVRQDGVPPNPSVEGVELSFRDPGPYLVGGSTAAIATFTPAGNYRNEAWSSSNPSVATIDQNGSIRFISPGRTAIRVEATANDGSRVYTQVEIAVYSHTGSGDVAISEDRFLVNGTLTLYTDTFYNLSFYSTPRGAHNFSATNLPAGLSMSAAGNLTGRPRNVGSYDARIHGVYHGAVYTRDVRITVLERGSNPTSGDIRDIQIGFEGSGPFVVGGTTTGLTQIDPPGNYVEYWWSRDPNIVEVDQQGHMRFIKAGKTFIDVMVRSSNGGVFTADREIVVYPQQGDGEIQILADELDNGVLYLKLLENYSIQVRSSVEGAYDFSADNLPRGMVMAFNGWLSGAPQEKGIFDVSVHAAIGDEVFTGNLRIDVSETGGTEVIIDEYYDSGSSGCNSGAGIFTLLGGFLLTVFLPKGNKD